MNDENDAQTSTNGKRHLKPNNLPTFSLLTTLRYDPTLLRSTENKVLCSDNDSGSPFYMPLYHRDRLQAAALAFGWDKAAAAVENAGKFEKFLTDELHSWKRLSEVDGKVSGDTALRLRITLDHTGRLSATFNVTPPVSDSVLYPSRLDLFSSTSTTPSEPSYQPWETHVATAVTEPSLFTRFKTTERSAYTHAVNSLHTEFSTPGNAAQSDVILQNPLRNLTEGARTTVYVHRNGEWVTPPLSSGCQEGTTRRWALEKGLCIEKAVDMASLRTGEKIWLSNGVWGFSKAVIKTIDSS